MMIGRYKEQREATAARNSITTQIMLHSTRILPNKYPVQFMLPATSLLPCHTIEKKNPCLLLRKSCSRMLLIRANKSSRHGEFGSTTPRKFRLLRVHTYHKRRHHIVHKFLLVELREFMC